MPLEERNCDGELRVWQRVNDCRLPESGDIRPLLLTAAESVAVYAHLAQVLTGKQREVMTRLQEAARRSLHVLQGIQSMSGHSAGNLRPVPVPKERPRLLLEKSYHRALRQMTEYTARSLDPEYGMVYHGLADREREAALALAELVGGLKHQYGPQI